jgi:nitroimidazol reductase NimA-like FMN-containing flavoprotein (pyridoxamine 5'-phosphate oxidase superfamily)
MATEHWFKSHLRELRKDDCLELLASHTVGRLCFVDTSGPMVMPVNYRVLGERILIATSPFGEIARHAVDNDVALEIDETDDYSETGWSVVVRGQATRQSQDSLPVDRDEWPQPWAEGTRSLVISISPRLITGRRLLPA